MERPQFGTKRVAHKAPLACVGMIVAVRKAPEGWTHSKTLRARGGRGSRASVLECGGRAQRRHRFRAEGTHCSILPVSGGRKRRDALLPAAVHDTSWFASRRNFRLWQCHMRIKNGESRSFPQIVCRLFAGLFRIFYQPRTWAKISGATIVASDSMMYLGVFTPSLPQVIFSLGTAPE